MRQPIYTITKSNIARIIARLKALLAILALSAITIPSASGLGVTGVTITGVAPNPIPCGQGAVVSATINYFVRGGDFLPMGPVLVRLYENDGGFRKFDEVLSITTLTFPLTAPGRRSINVTFPVNCAAPIGCLCDFSGNNDIDDEHGEHELYVQVVSGGGGDWGPASADEIVTCIKPDSTIASLTPSSSLFPGGQVAVAVGLNRPLDNVSSFTTNLVYDTAFFTVDSFATSIALSGPECGSFGFGNTFQLFCGYPNPVTIPADFGMLYLSAAPNTPFGEYMISIDTTSEFFDPGFNHIPVEMGTDWLMVVPVDSTPPQIDTALINFNDSTITGNIGSVTDNFVSIESYVEIEVIENDSLPLGGAYIEANGSFSMSGFGIQLRGGMMLTLRANDAAGNASEVSFVYGSECSPPLTTGTSKITPNSARLEWDSLDGVHHYQIRGKVSSNSNFIFITLPPGAPNFKDVFGLSNNTSFDWQIRSFCSASPADSSEWSALTVFITGCYEPDSIFTNPVTSSGARLNWTQASGAEGYEINGRIVGNTNSVSILVGSSASHKDVFGLQSNTNYEWRIRTYCTVSGSVKSSYTPFVQFTTSSGNRVMNGNDPFDPNNSKELMIFPNPAKDKIHVSYPGSNPTMINVWSATGELVFSKPNGPGNATLLTDAWPSGLYIVEVQTDESVFREKVVVE